MGGKGILILTFGFGPPTDNLDHISLRTTHIIPVDSSIPDTDSSRVRTYIRSVH